MLEVVRRGVFETNSSSVHSITMCSDDEYTRWKNGELLFKILDETFVNKKELIENIKTEDIPEYYENVEDYLFEKGYYSYDEYWDYVDLIQNIRQNLVK